VFARRSIQTRKNVKIKILCEAGGPLLRSSRAREACSGPILRGTGSRSQLRVSWKQCVLLLPPRAREATVRTHTPRDRVGIAIAANLETVCPHLAQLARAGRAQDPYCEVRVEVAIAGKLETVVRVCLRAQGSLQKGMGAAPRQVFPVASFFFFQISFLRIRKASMSRGPWPFCCDRPVGEAYRLAQAPRPPVPRRRRPGAAVDQVKQLTTSNDGHARLTPRELEVLTAMADGATNKAIARRMGISFHTVEFHVAAILEKLDADTRTEAVMKAAQLGIVML